MNIPPAAASKTGFRPYTSETAPTGANSLVDDDAEKARQILEQTMTDAFVATFPGAPTTGLVVVKIGRTWADVK